MAEQVIKSIQFKRGTKIRLEAVLVGDNKPLQGEPIYESDTGKFKIGDGVHGYAELPYIGNGSAPMNQIFFGTHYEFPAIGEEDKLYVAKDEHNSYIWENNKYIILSVNQHEIDAGGADAQY